MNLTKLSLLASELVALNSWSKISFIDDREASTFTTIVERIKVQISTFRLQETPNKGAEFAPLNAPLSALQSQLLRLLQQNPKASYELLMTKLERNRSTVMRNIQKLKEAGLLSRRGSKKTGYWSFNRLLSKPALPRKI